MEFVPIIRPATADDALAVYALLEQAFGGKDEADLVIRLHDANLIVDSLVAQIEDQVVGYIAFSPVTIDGAAVPVLALAPIAVSPKFQRQQIGSNLMRSGLERCRHQGSKAIVLLGNPSFYRRFGFVRASKHGISCEAHYPQQFFQVLFLDDHWCGAGLVRYNPLFNGV
jgi:putative acetyltransferase